MPRSKETHTCKLQSVTPAAPSLSRDTYLQAAATVPRLWLLKEGPADKDRVCRDGRAPGASACQSLGEGQEQPETSRETSWGQADAKVCNVAGALAAIGRAASDSTCARRGAAARYQGCSQVKRLHCGAGIGCSGQGASDSTCARRGAAAR